MIHIKNYFKETSVRVKKFGLWLKGLIGTAAASAYIQSDVKTAFYLLLAGAVITGILELLPPDNEQTSGDKSALKGAAPIAAALIALICLVSSCSVIRPGSDTVKTDSTKTTFTHQTVDVKGAKVTASLNIDSLLKAATKARLKQQLDSAAYAQKLAQYKVDSAAAAKAGKPLTETRPAPPKPQTQYVTDPQTKAQLSYWIDQYDNLQVGCESKDQAIDVLTTQIDHLKSQVTTKTVVSYKTSVWAYVVMAIVGVLSLILFILYQTKKGA